MSTTSLVVHLDADSLAALLIGGSVEAEVFDTDQPGQMPIGTMLVVGPEPERDLPGLGTPAVLPAVALFCTVADTLDADQRLIRGVLALDDDADPEPGAELLLGAFRLLSPDERAEVRALFADADWQTRQERARRERRGTALKD